jgi:glucokinase
MGVVISVPGMVDERAGKVLFSPNLHWTESTSLSDLISEVWQAPAVLIQELRALALGHLSVDDTGDDFLLVDVGEGVGAAAVISGELYRNQLPLSGELGHTPVKGNSRMCGCGAAGCLETLLSQRGLIHSFADAQPSEEPAWASLLATLQSDPVPSWLGETLDAAGTVIAGALNMLGLSKAVLTGLLGELPDDARRQLEAAIARGTIWQRFGHIEVEFAPRYRTAGMVAVGIDRCVVPADPPVRVRRLASSIRSAA